MRALVLLLLTSAAGLAFIDAHTTHEPRRITAAWVCLFFCAAALMVSVRMAVRDQGAPLSAGSTP